MNSALVVRDALENSRGGRADGDDSAACGAAAVDLLCHLVGYVEILAVHQVLLDLIDLDGTEGAESNVKRDLAVAYAHSLDALDELLCEMKSCGGSGGRALLLCIDGLVVALALESLGDVGRKRHIADLVEHLVDALIFRGVVVESDGSVASLNDARDGGGENSAEVEGRALLGTLAGAHESLPLARIESAKQKKLHIRAGLLGLAEKARGNDLGGVHNEHILGAKIVDDIEEVLMLYSAVAVEHHKPASVALLRGSLRYELLRQIVEEILCLQVCFNSVIYDYVVDLFHCFLL